MEITWDSEKAASNFKKHGVTFTEAVSALDDPFQIVLEDERFEEERFGLLGFSDLYRILVVIYVYRTIEHIDGKDRETIRIVSARAANASERRNYAENRRGR